MEDKNQLAIDVINLTDRLLREFADTNQSLAPRGIATRSLQNWQPPSYGVVKINFDGAVFDSRTEMGAGVIARDAAGECLAWRTRNFRFAANPSLAESLAAREAIDLGIKEGWSNIILEGDYQSVINRLIGSTEDFSTIGPVIADIHFMMRQVSHCNVEYIPRQFNSFAHKLARSATHNAEYRNHFPDFIL
ncbi:UNVERIFIED_CONTAM: hypothetical protein Slati_4186800 [Sesamum latifolium]|uniref:RNase H type-1 domain-containing protein n=1 Tax=Sesamum latifolium TaxID=2727402 RepID=A0AAW2TAL9_9LAMI